MRVRPVSGSWSTFSSVLLLRNVVTYLQVGERGVEVDTPVDETVGSVNELLLMQSDESFSDGFAQRLLVSAAFVH